MYARLKADVDANGAFVIAGGNRMASNWNYARAYMAAEASLVYAISGNSSYANVAYDALRAVHDDPDPDRRLPDEGYGLSRATVGMGFAIAYDLCKSAWTTEQRNAVRGRIVAALDAWPSYSHANLSLPYGSNWVAVCRGAEVALMVSAGEQGARAGRLSTILSQLRQHVGHYGNAGWGQEGNHYTPYAGQFLLPAAIALSNLGDATLKNAIAAKNPWQVVMYAGMFDAAQDSTQWGVGGAGLPPAGYTSLLFPIVPPEHLAHYKWFYDRYRGDLNPAVETMRFDREGFGLVLAMMFYPQSTVAADPDPALPSGLNDNKGGYWLRSGWNNADDVIVSLGTDTSSHDRAWNEADALQLNIAGFGTRFSGGPGTSGKAENFSQILVDGGARTAVDVTGGAVALETTATSAYAIASGGAKFSGMGVSDAVRHVRMDKPGSFAVISTLDKLRAASPKTYAWQLNTLGLPASSGNEAGLPTFTIYGKDGAYLKGWVVAPAGAVISTGGPLRVTAPRTASTDIWVVMALGRGAAPVPEVAGEGLAANVRLRDRLVTFNTAADRITTTTVAATSPRADFSVTPPAGSAPLAVLLDAGASSDPEGQVLTYSWDFGDGTAANGATVAKTYQTQGDYDVGLRVSDGTHEDRAVRRITVSNTPPVAVLAASPSTGALPLEVHFNGGGSTDADGHALTYQWDFGDGTSATGVNVTKTYAVQGTFYPVLTVTDGHGGSGSETGIIHAGNRAPVASVTASAAQGLPPLPVTFSGNASTDPDGDPLTYSWDFGDGTSATGRDVGKTFTTYGTFPVVLTVSDGNGNSASATKTIQIENKPPVARIDANTTSGNAPFTAAFSGNGSSDPEGEGLTYAWDFGDGTSGSGATANKTYATSGQYRVTLHVTDARGGQGLAQKEISVLDAQGRRAPDAVTDPLPGMLYQAAAVDSVDFPNFSELTPFRSGIINAFETRLDAPPSMFAFRFAGYLHAPADGTYTFHYKVRDTLVLSFGGVEVINLRTRDLSGALQSGSGTIALKAGWHRFEMLHHFADAGDFNEKIPWLEVTWSGPGFANEPISASDLGWIPGAVAPAFEVSAAPENVIPPPTVNFLPTRRDDLVVLHAPVSGGSLVAAFEARGSEAPGDKIVSYAWDFGDGTTGSGPNPRHSFSPGDYRIVLTVRTAKGGEASVGRLLRVENPPADLNRARESAKSLSASGGEPAYAFDGDRSKDSRWLVWSDEASVELHFANGAIRNRYVIDEYAITNPNDWNTRDPKEIRFYGSNDGKNWTLLDERLNVNWGGLRETTLRFPVTNTQAYSSYRVDTVPTAESPQGWISEVQEIELYDHGTGFQPVNRPPVGAFTAPSASEVGAPVSFDASASSDADGDPLAFFWDFGDGQTAHTESPQVAHVYRSAGNVSARLFVRDSRGAVTAATARSVAIISGENAPPLAAFSAAPSEPTAPGTVQLDASATSDPNGDALTYHWEFGDGTTGEGIQVAHAYEWGDFGVRLTVRDSKGAVGVATDWISVSAPATPRSIGINFVKSGDRYFSLLPAETAGLVPCQNWNNVSASPAAGLFDNTGAVTTVSVAFSASGIGTNAISPTGPSVRLLGHNLGHSSNTHSVTLSNIPYSSYRIYVLFGATPDNGTPGVFAVSLGSQTRYLADADRAFDGVLDESQAILPDQAVDGREYVVFRALSGSTQTLNFPGAGRLGPAAIQIVEGQDADGLAPNFTLQPTSQASVMNRDVTFLATAKSRTAVTYQWLKDGLALAESSRLIGVTTPRLRIAGITGADAGEYVLRVTNADGTTLSEAAELSVSAASDLSLDEPFNYPSGDYSGTWSDATTSAGYSASTNLAFAHPSYEGRSNTGGAVTFSSNNAFRGIQRAVTQAPEPGTFWVSALVRMTSTTSGSMLFLALHDSASAYSSSTPRGDGFGVACDGSQLRAAYMKTSTGTITFGTANATPIGTNSAFLAVAKVTIGGGADSLRLWLLKEGDSFDPTESGMGAPLLEVNDADFGAGLRHLWIGQFKASGAIDAIRMSGLSGDAGLLAVLGLAPPILTIQPVALVLNVGESATFRVATTGVSPSFQWEKNGLAISEGDGVSGTRTPVLRIAAATPQDEGSYRVRVTTNAGEALSDAAPLQLNSPVTPLQQWFQSHGLPTDGSGSGNPFADPDADGLPNLLEYAFGGLPGSAASQPAPTVGVAKVAGQDYLRITIPKNPAASGIQYLVEVGADLTNWQSGPAFTSVMEETSGSLVVRDNTPLGTVPRRFIRVRVSLP